jgi:hypothetical protein
MRRIVTACGVAASLAALCGCASQEIIQREYYEPTERTLLEREDKLKVGALKQDDSVSDVVLSVPLFDGESHLLVGIIPNAFKGLQVALVEPLFHALRVNAGQDHRLLGQVDGERGNCDGKREKVC